MPLFGSLKWVPEEQCANPQKMSCRPKGAYELLAVTLLWKTNSSALPSTSWQLSSECQPERDELGLFRGFHRSWEELTNTSLCLHPEGGQLLHRPQCRSATPALPVPLPQDAESWPVLIKIYKCCVVQAVSFPNLHWEVWSCNWAHFWQHRTSKPLSYQGRPYIFKNSSLNLRHHYLIQLNTGLLILLSSLMLFII